MSEIIVIDSFYYVIGSKDRFVYKFQNTVSLEVEWSQASKHWFFIDFIIDLDQSRF